MRKCWKSKSSRAGKKVNEWQKKHSISFSFAFQGTKITFEGEGDAADEHTIPGDIVFIIRDRPHPIFERSHSDLIYRVKLTLKQALLGTLLVIPFLNSSKAPHQLRTYREVLAPQAEKRFSDEGLPYPKEPTRRGDLIVKFDILFPKVLNAEQRSLIDSCFSNSMEFYQAHNSPLHTTIIDPTQTPSTPTPPPPTSTPTAQASSHPHQKSSHRHPNGNAGFKSPASPSQTINPTKGVPPVAPTPDVRGTVFWNAVISLQSDF
jgi:DnaJ-class molecular chaperone